MHWVFASFLTFLIMLLIWILWELWCVQRTYKTMKKLIDVADDYGMPDKWYEDTDPKKFDEHCKRLKFFRDWRNLYDPDLIRAAGMER